MSLGRPILIAEDDVMMAKLLRELAKPFGREIHRAPDGDSVLAMLRELRPGLLILDLNMPKRNGLEVLRSVRRDPAFNRLNVLVITGQGQPETEDKVREAGADAYLSKPVNIRYVRERIGELITAERVVA